MWPRSWPRLGVGSFPPPSDPVSGRLETYYDHGPRAGNKADVWKHFILLSTVEFLVRQEGPCGTPFHYLETHCGKGLYVLEENGAWREGIGKTASLPAPLASHAYFRLVGAPRGAGGFYLGSWLLVGLQLQSLGMEFRMSLYDVSREVEKHLAFLGLIAQRGSPVRFVCEDGFGALDSEEMWDLALVDPPFAPDPKKDKMECENFCGLLPRFCKVFLVWYPLCCEQDPGLELLEAQEAWEIIWGRKEKASSMAGCGMLMGGKLGPIPQDFFYKLELLAQRLDGSFRRRRV